MLGRHVLLVLLGHGLHSPSTVLAHVVSVKHDMHIGVSSDGVLSSASEDQIGAIELQYPGDERDDCTHSLRHKRPIPPGDHSNPCAKRQSAERARYEARRAKEGPAPRPSPGRPPGSSEPWGVTESVFGDKTTSTPPKRHIHYNRTSSPDGSGRSPMMRRSEPTPTPHEDIAPTATNRPFMDPESQDSQADDDDVELPPVGKHVNISSNTSGVNATPKEGECLHTRHAASILLQEQCPRECPFWAEDDRAAKYCHFKCVAASECGEEGAHTLNHSSVPDPALGFCRRCSVLGCRVCDYKSQKDICKECKTELNFVLSEDGRCEFQVPFVGAFSQALLVLIVAGPCLYLTIWYISLCRREQNNLHGLELGLKFRSATKLCMTEDFGGGEPVDSQAQRGGKPPARPQPEQPANEGELGDTPGQPGEAPPDATQPSAQSAGEAGDEFPEGAEPPAEPPTEGQPGDSLPQGTLPSAEPLAELPKAGHSSDVRRLWPLRTNLMQVPVAGPGSVLFFRFQCFIMTWALGIGVLWVVIALSTEPKLLHLGTEIPRSPREQCKHLTEGYDTQHSYMWAKLIFLSCTYVISFVFCLIFAVHQKRTIRRLDDRSTPSDFAACVEGLPAIPGSGNLEEELKSFMQNATGQEVVGVSVCWDITEAGERIYNILEKEVIKIEDQMALEEWDGEEVEGEELSSKGEEGDSPEKEKSDEPEGSEEAKQDGEGGGDVSAKAAAQGLSESTSKTWKKSLLDVEGPFDPTERPKLLKWLDNMFVVWILGIDMEPDTGKKPKEETQGEGAEQEGTGEEEGEQEDGEAGKTVSKKRSDAEATEAEGAEGTEPGKTEEPGAEEAGEAKDGTPKAEDAEEQKLEEVKPKESEDDDPDADKMSPEELAASLTSTPYAFIVFKTEEARDAALKTDNLLFKGSPLTIRYLNTEPNGVLWHNFGIPRIQLLARVRHAILGLVGAIIGWGLCIYLPYATYASSFSYENGDKPHFMITNLFAIIVAVGNLSMYAICMEASKHISFLLVDTQEGVYLIMYTIAVMFNILLDFSVHGSVAYSNAVASHARTYHGVRIEDLEGFQEIVESFEIQHQLGRVLYSYCWPWLFLFPFVLEAMLANGFTRHLSKLVVSRFPHITGYKAQKALQIFIPMDGSRYADIIVNLFAGSLCFFLPGGFTTRIFFFLVASHVFIIGFDHYRVLRCVPAFVFSSDTVDVYAQEILTLPVAMTLSAIVFKGNCIGKGPCLTGFSLGGAMAFVFFAHCAVHRLLLKYAVPRMSAGGDKQIKVDVGLEYGAVAQRFSASWFNTNPGHCLRSQFFHKHETPCSLLITGREHALRKNENIGNYFEDRRPGPFEKEY